MATYMTRSETKETEPVMEQIRTHDLHSFQFLWSPPAGEFPCHFRNCQDSRRFEELRSKQSLGKFRVG